MEGVDEHWEDKCQRYITSLQTRDSVDLEAGNFKICSDSTNTQQQQQHVAQARVERVPGNRIDTDMNTDGSPRSWLFLTSIHGLPFLARSSGPASRCFWLIVVLAGCGAFGFIGYHLITQYIRRENSAVISYGTPSEPSKFPAITVCNLNPLRKSKLQGTIFYNLSLLDNHRIGSAQTPKTVSTNNNLAYRLRIHPELRAYLSNPDSSSGNDILEDIEADFLRMEHVENDFDWDGLYLASLRSGYLELRDGVRPTTRDYQLLGHDPAVTLIRCLFNGKECIRRDHKEAIHHSYGRCFSIMGDFPQVVVDGKKTLELLLNIEADEYVGVLSPSVGALISIHHSAESLSEQSAARISPGEVTHLGTRLKELKRASPCETNTPYTLQGCEMNCLHKHEFQLCECTTNFDDVIHRKCNFTDKVDYICTKLLAKLQTRGRLRCDCQEKCLEDVYVLKRETMEWPSVQYLPHLKAELQMAGLTMDEQSIRNNVAKVVISFDNSLTEKVTITADMTLWDLLISLGGASAMLGGVSVIAVLEIFWVLMVACYRCCARKCQRRKMENYVQHFEEADETTPPIFKVALSRNCSRRNSQRRNTSKAVNRNSSKMRLGGNRRPPRRLESRHYTYQNDKNASTSNGTNCRRKAGDFLPRRENTRNLHILHSDEKGASPESSTRDYSDSGRPPSKNLQKGERIVPRLNLDDLISQSENDLYPHAWDLNEDQRCFQRVLVSGNERNIQEAPPLNAPTAGHVAAVLNNIKCLGNMKNGQNRQLEQSQAQSGIYSQEGKSRFLSVNGEKYIYAPRAFTKY